MKQIPANMLRSRLAQGQSDGPHPDADLLAAFAEDTLLGGERTHVLAHLAGCETCRAVVRTAAAAEPEPAPLAAKRPSRPPLRAWLPGVALAAALFVMGASTILFYRSIHANFHGTQSAADTAAPQIPAPPPSAPEPAAEESATPKPQISAAAPTSGVPAKRRTPAAARAHLNPAAEPALQSEQAEGYSRGVAAPPPPPATGLSANSSSGDLSNRSAQIAPPAVDQAQMQSARNMSTHHAGMSAAKSAARASAPATVTQSVQVQPANGFAASPQPLRAIGGFSNVSAAHPRFRINDAGHIERSAESGVWTPIPVAADVRFRVLSISGADVWAGGDNLRLFHSADNGLTWTEVQLPANADRAHAIAHIRIDSAQALTVESDDGTSWTTAEGGATWHQVPDPAPPVRQ